MVLIDSSVWIAFFRGGREAIRRLDPLLADGSAAITGPILAEVTSGARTRTEFVLLSSKLKSLSWVDPPSGVWGLVGETRFALARQGVQAHLVDLLLAHTAYAAGCELLTSDRDFERIGRVLPVSLVLI